MSSHFFKKSFGQNFLKYKSTAEKIISYLDFNTKNIIEIGPGAGILTEKLLDKNFNVISVEIDKLLYEPLQTKFESFNNFSLIKADILEFNIEDLALGDYSVIGSLPYNISKKVISKFLSLENQPKEMVFLVQKEVAKNYVAMPPKATFLSNYVRIFGEIEYLLTIKKEEFFPEPKVDGGLIKIIPKNKANNNNIIKFIKNGYRSPRKTLVNTLSSIYKIDKMKLINFLLEHKLNGTVRASELTLKEWKLIYELIMD